MNTMTNQVIMFDKRMQTSYFTIHWEQEGRIRRRMRMEKGRRRRGMEKRRIRRRKKRSGEEVGGRGYGGEKGGRKWRE